MCKKHLAGARRVGSKRKWEHNFNRVIGKIGYENGRCTQLAQIIPSGRVMVLLTAEWSGSAIRHLLSSTHIPIFPSLDSNTNKEPMRFALFREITQRSYRVTV
jgi:hypothetical protein